MAYPTLLSSNDIQPLADGVYDVLERVGLLCQNDELIQALSDSGAHIDAHEQRAWFPKRVTRNFVEALRSEFSTEATESTAADAAKAENNADEGKSASVRIAWDTQIPDTLAAPLPTFGTQIAQAMYDYPTATKRSGNRNDLIELIKLADVLHPEIPAGHCLVDAAVPGRIEALESALVLAEYAHSPGKAFAWYTDQIDYLREMGEVMGITDWFDWGAICFAHPLRFDRDVADKLVRRAREGFSTGLTAMPVAGCSTPVTVEGFVVVAAAEHIATWFSARALNPVIPLGGSMWAGAVDPASGRVSYSSFDAMHRAFATVEFLSRWTGLRIAVGGGEYCDAREPGMAAAYEKAYKAMTIAAFTGDHPPAGEGLLECGRVLAPVQLILERDFLRGEAHLFGQIETTREKIGIDSIVEIGLGIDSNHLMTGHTLEHFRNSLWLPDVMDRTGWAGVKSDTSVLDRAQHTIDELKRSYRKPEGRGDVLDRMKSIVNRARKSLLR
jgi:trimethylamine:corrinoid methyltransferase-like protein